MNHNELLTHLRNRDIYAEYRASTGAYTLTDANRNAWQHPIVLLVHNQEYELWDVGGLEAALRLSGHDEHSAATKAAALAASEGFNYRHGVRWSVGTLEEVVQVYQKMLDLIVRASSINPEKP